MFGWPKISSDNRKKMSEHSIKFAMCPKLIMEESSVMFAELLSGFKVTFIYFLGSFVAILRHRVYFELDFKANKYYRHCSQG